MVNWTPGRVRRDQAATADRWFDSCVRPIQHFVEDKSHWPQSNCDSRMRKRPVHELIRLWPMLRSIRLIVWVKSEKKKIIKHPIKIDNCSIDWLNWNRECTSNTRFRSKTMHCQSLEISSQRSISARGHTCLWRKTVFKICNKKVDLLFLFFVKLFKV